MRETGLLLSLLLCGCSCGGPGTSTDGDDGPPGCSDSDHDEYGVGADCSGPDCDDTNPSVWTEDQCAALCDEDPQSTGCPCDAPEPIVCFTGPAETLGVGPCQGGLRICEGGFWGGCVGQVLPTDEVCNEVDDDCDAEADEGVTNE